MRIEIEDEEMSDGHVERYTTVVADVEAVDDPDGLVAAIADAHDGLDALQARDDHIGDLTFEFERSEGERLDDDDFFKQACRHERGRERTADFLRAFIAWRDHIFETEGRGQMYSWTDPRKTLQPTLLGAAFRLAEADAQYAPLYADFIERTDLEHEGDQPTHIDAIVDKHGWTPGVRDLLAARLTTARGQRSREQFQNHAPLIRANLPTPRHESALFDQLFADVQELCTSGYGAIAIERARRWGERLLDDDEQRAWMARVWETADLTADDLSEDERVRLRLLGVITDDRPISDIDLSGTDLDGINLSDRTLRDINLRDTTLRNADLSGTDLRGAVLSGADLHDANLRTADVREADLHGCDLQDADLRAADLQGADFTDADLTDARLPDGDLSSTTFDGAILSGTRFEEA